MRGGPRRILVVNGHPDGDRGHLCNALAHAYGQGAISSGREVRRLDLAALDIPFLRNKKEFEGGIIPREVETSVGHILWADHIVFVFPLWLGTMPALFKAWLEQTFRPGTVFRYRPNGLGTTSLLDGKSARVIVTMGTPAPIYRLWFLSHGVAGFRRNILNFAGIRPVRETLFGMVEQASPDRRRNWIEKVAKMGGKGI